jgi:hypothetical protein
MGWTFSQVLVEVLSDRVENGNRPRSCGGGTLSRSGKRVPRNGCRDQGIDPAHVALLRGAFAPHFLVPLDPVVPAPLANARLEVRSYLGNILPLTYHAASHFVAVGIDC